MSAAKPEMFTADIREMSRDIFTAAYFSMSEERRKKCDSYMRERDKKLCIAADYLVRKALAEKTGNSPESFVFYRGIYGKPFCRGCDIPFSLTHTEHIAAAAVGGKNSVGIDAELIKPVNAGILRYFCSPSDFEYIGVEPDCRAHISEPAVLEKIFRVWTFKEAYSKCTGTGLNEKIKELSLNEAECDFCFKYNCCFCIVQK